MILLEIDYRSDQPLSAITSLVANRNHERYHENLNNPMQAQVCDGPGLHIRRAHRKFRRQPLSERVWTPPLMQAVFGRLGACGQVLSCVRPLYAADDTPRARMEMRGLGPNRLRELESSPFGCWFSRPGLVDLCPYLSSVLPTSPTAFRTSPFSQVVAGAR